MKIGLFGGSFNPIHNGHIHLAKTACENLSLDRVIFIPTYFAPHKETINYVDCIHRFNMCKLATEDTENFEVSDYEIKKQGISYSIYTVEHFKDIYMNDELYFIMGSDMFLCFDKWYRYRDILKKVSLAVATREENLDDRLKKQAEIIGKYGKIHLFKTPPLPMSSTKIRNLLKNNQNTYCYLNKKVVKYIMTNNLYK